MRLSSTTLAAAAAAILALGGGLPQLQAGDDIRTTARAVAGKSSKAVVTAKLIVALKFMGKEDEQKIEVNGTVIESSGLTVVCASEIDPASLFKDLLGDLGDGGQMDPVSKAWKQMDSAVKETCLILDDGTEVDADVVLKDADLDLAFIRPRDATREFVAIPLKPRGKAPQMLEDIFILSRLGRIHDRAPSISLGKVKATVKGPRPYAVCDSETSSGTLGCVAFDATGAPLGVFVLKRQAGGSGTSSPMGFIGGLLGGGGSSFGPAAPILRSVGDVLEIAEQAKAVKPPEKESAEEGGEKRGVHGEEGEEESEEPPPGGEDEE